MDHHTMRSLWIKAAIEHRVVRLEYHDPISGGDVTTRDVDPDVIESWLGLGHLFPRRLAGDHPEDLRAPTRRAVDGALGGVSKVGIEGRDRMSSVRRGGKNNGAGRDVCHAPTLGYRVLERPQARAA